MYLHQALFLLYNCIFRWTVLIFGINSDNSPAASVLFRKKIDGTYYALEVVPDSAKCTAYVKSLDIEPGDGVYGKYQKIIKEADNRLPNANNLGQTSENRAFSTSDSNVADSSANINTRNEIADALQGREVITEYNGQPIYRSVIAQDKDNHHNEEKNAEN